MSIRQLDATTNKLKTCLGDAAKSMTIMGNATGELKNKLSGISDNFKKLQNDLTSIP